MALGLLSNATKGINELDYLTGYAYYRLHKHSEFKIKKLQCQLK